jgi:hypothetical protein
MLSGDRVSVGLRTELDPLTAVRQVSPLPRNIHQKAKAKEAPIPAATKAFI